MSRKEKILEEGSKAKVNKTNTMYMVGFVLSVYATAWIIISFYIVDGIYFVDMVVSTILSLLALILNIKFRKDVKDKNIFITIGMILSIISIVLLLPNLFNFIRYFNLNIRDFILYY